MCDIIRYILFIKYILLYTIFLYIIFHHKKIELQGLELVQIIFIFFDCFINRYLSFDLNIIHLNRFEIFTYKLKVEQ